METNIRYLELLERDLMQIAVLEKGRTVAKAPSRWRSWLVAAAAVLVVAFAIGALAQLGSGNQRKAAFSTVGSAVDGGVTGAVPAPSSNTHRGARSSADQPKAADLSKIVRDGTISLSVPDGSFGPKLARVVAIAHAPRIANWSPAWPSAIQADS